VRPSYRCAFVACICLCSAALTRAEEPWRIDAPDRIIALADIHGAQTAFRDMLMQVGAIDANDDWAAGTARLVIVGDVLDRGPDSRQALDLIMALQQDAPAAGGSVHFVLGNHEVMNLTGDLRYVSREEFAAFAPSETSEMRAAGFADFIARSDTELAPEAAQAEFDRRYPAGYFAHRVAFSPEGDYGAWLLEQPVLLVAHDSVFVHGGLSRAFEGLSGEDINATLKRQLREYIDAMAQLTAAGVLSSIDDFYDHPAIIAAFEQRVAAGEATWTADVESAAAQASDLNDALLFDLASPIWYRGMVACSPLVGGDHWQDMLDQLGVARVVVGHTPTPDHRVLNRMQGGIVRIDTGMLASYYGGQAAALVIDDDQVLAVHAGEANAGPIAAQPRRVGRRPAELTDDALAAVLREGTITAQSPTETGPLRITISTDDVSVDADFYPAADDSLRPEVAAYRLDRLLGLDMVPVTISRSVDGIDGSVQFRPAGALTESERSAQGTGGSAWCPLRDQFPSMYVFDTLVYNEGRTVEQIAYDAESYQLLLLGHERTFSTRRGRPAHLREATLEITPAWRDALEGLDEERLSTELGDWLSRRQIRALSRRVDEILSDAADN
jgi:hypothetical protein